MSADVTFEEWHSALSALTELVMPRIVEAYAPDVRRVEAALTALHTFTARVIVVLATEFIRHKNEAVRESVAHAGAVLEAATDAVLILDDDAQIVDLNSAGVRMFGFERDRAIGMNLADLFSPDAVLGDCPLAEVRRAGAAACLSILDRRIDVDVLRSDGRAVPVQLVLSRTSPAAGATLTAFVRDVSAEKQVHDALAASEERLRALAARLQVAIEEERTRIAREVHDELGQLLAALGHDIGWLVGQQTGAAPLVTERLAAMAASVNALVDITRRIAAGLRPGILDDVGIGAALEWHAREFERRSGIALEMSLPDEELELMRDHATALFRIFQELLTNVSRHAQASQVRVELDRRGDEIALQVADDGRGIRRDEGAGSGALGLVGIRERAHLLGGRVDIDAPDSGGTVVTVRLPATPPEAKR